MPTHSPLNTLSDFDLASHVLNVCRIQCLGAAFVAHWLLHSGRSRPSEKGGRGVVIRPWDEVGGRTPRIFFSVLRASFWSKNKGGGAGPPAPPLDPPLLQWMGRGGGRGGGFQNFLFRSLGPHCGRNMRGGPAPPGPSPGSATAAMHASKLYCFLNVCTAATVFILCVLYWVFDVVSMIYLQKSWYFCSHKKFPFKD